MNGSALGENEIRQVEDNINNIEKLVSQWEGLQSQLESILNSSAGTTFTGYFTIGRKYSKKILGITNILHDIEGAIRALIASTEEFIRKQREANEREFSNSN